MPALVDADILHVPAFVDGDEAARFFAQLRGEIPWRQHQLRLFGRRLPAPRLSSWHGDAGARYRYSGLELEPLPWTAALSALRERVEAACAARFNGVLLNYYRDGRDSVGWHSDDEPELGPTIASLSLGAARRFLLRHKRCGQRAEYALGRGDLLVMRPPTQRHWQHRIAPTRRPVGGRINLTFRTILPGE